MKILVRFDLMTESTKFTESDKFAFELVQNLVRSPGAFPQTGKFSSKIWAQLFGMTEKNFKELLKESGIPYFKFGSNVIVDANDFWASQKQKDA
ncbi:hypothetical protein Pan241w_59510 [Gimesia alba]|uniref:Uncharacterized protein n=2 Tax=Gimesia alba TaxID=2527973 RepID=A0A517RPL1_9PLAN|nr:hypothetical protein Pan241w_59510 [Gimesia alba]